MTNVQPTGLAGDQTHSLDVARPRPVGRIEWVDTPVRLYGVDAAGQVWAFPHPLRTPARESALRRLAKAIAFPRGRRAV